MKAKHIVYTVLGITFIVIMAAVVYIVSPKEREIYAYSYYGYNNGIVIGTHKVKKIESLNRTDTVIHVLDDNEFFEAMKKSQYFVSECDIKRSTQIHHGFLYYYNDNSYFLYQVEHGLFYLVNLYADINYQDDPYVEFTFPAYMNLIYSWINKPEENEKRIANFFMYYDYEAAKQFYQVYKNGFVAFDDVNQIIRVKAYDGKAISSYPCIVLDYANRNIGYLDKAGNIIWLTETGE